MGYLRRWVRKWLDVPPPPPLPPTLPDFEKVERGLVRDAAVILAACELRLATDETLAEMCCDFCKQATAKHMSHCKAVQRVRKKYAEITVRLCEQNLARAKAELSRRRAVK